VDDIGIVNGTINSGSFTKVSATQYTIMVTPSSNIPTANILIKGMCVIKHPRHIGHLANIPTANILIKGSCIRKCSVCITCITLLTKILAVGMLAR
jgi:hypothetical protein